MVFKPSTKLKPLFLAGDVMVLATAPESQKKQGLVRTQDRWMYFCIAARVSLL